MDEQSHYEVFMDISAILGPALPDERSDAEDGDKCCICDILPPMIKKLHAVNSQSANRRDMASDMETLSATSVLDLTEAVQATGKDIVKHNVDRVHTTSSTLNVVQSVDRVTDMVENMDAVPSCVNVVQTNTDAVPTYDVGVVENMDIVPQSVISEPRIMKALPKTDMDNMISDMDGTFQDFRELQDSDSDCYSSTSRPFEVREYERKMRECSRFLLRPSNTTLSAEWNKALAAEPKNKSVLPPLHDDELHGGEVSYYPHGVDDSRRNSVGTGSYRDSAVPETGTSNISSSGFGCESSVMESRIMSGRRKLKGTFDAEIDHQYSMRRPSDRTCVAINGEHGFCDSDSCESWGPESDRGPTPPPDDACYEPPSKVLALGNYLVNVTNAKLKSPKEKSAPQAERSVKAKSGKATAQLRSRKAAVVRSQQRRKRLAQQPAPAPAPTSLVWNPALPTASPTIITPSSSRCTSASASPASSRPSSPCSDDTCKGYRNEGKRVKHRDMERKRRSVSQILMETLKVEVLGVLNKPKGTRMSKKQTITTAQDLLVKYLNRINLLNRTIALYPTYQQSVAKAKLGNLVIPRRSRLPTIHDIQEVD